MEVDLHAENLKEEEQGKGVEIHLVYAAVDDEVAHQTVIKLGAERT